MVSASTCKKVLVLVLSVKKVVSVGAVLERLRVFIYFASARVFIYFDSAGGSVKEKKVCPELGFKRKSNYTMPM